MIRASWLVVAMMAWIWTPVGAQEAPESRVVAQDASASSDPGDSPAAPADTTPPVIPVAGIKPQESAPSAAPEEADAVVLDEIIVTATKRAKSSREVPVSIDAFNGEDLNQRGAQGAQDALPDSPGVSVNSYVSPNFASVQVRGTTVDTVTTTGGSPSGAFLDDIPLTSPTLLGSNPNIDAFDLATVEVLKGPQGTLFGGSALAGALRSTPNTPELMTFTGNGFYAPMSVSQSEGIGQDYGLMLNLPVGETLAVRAMGVRRSYPGVIDNLRDDVKDVDRYYADTWRGLLRWEPLEALSVHALFHQTQGVLEDAIITDNPDRLEQSRESGRSPTDFRYRIAQLKAEYGFETFSLAGASSGVRKTDNISVQVDALLGTQTPLTDVVSGPQAVTADIRTHELRAVSTQRTESSFLLLRDWDWLIGLFDYRADQSGFFAISAIVRPPLSLLPPMPIEAEHVEAVSQAKERALYFDLTRYAGSSFELNLGGRLFRQNLFGAASTNGGPVAGATVASNSGMQNSKGFNPKLALTWHASKQLALRAAAVKGFRFGGINAVVDNDPKVPLFYTTDELWSYELGLRSDWLDRRLRFDVTAFYIDWSRTQISQRSVSGLATYIDNVGSAISKGVEAQARALLPWGFSLSVGGAYIDARTAAEFQGQGGSIAAGTRLPGTPFVTGAAGLSYDFAIRNALLDSKLSWNYQGSAFNNLAHAALIPAYELFGAHLGLTLPGVAGQPAIGLNVTNLLDHRAYSGILPPVNPAQQGNAYFPIRPRTISLRISASFQ